MAVRDKPDVKRVARRESSPPVIEGLARATTSLTPVNPEMIEAKVKSLVTDLPALAYNLEPIQDMLRQTISQALIRRNIGEGDLLWPRMDVALPAIEALRYSSLQQEFANLIASSMDPATAPSVLPAYVELLKQLSTDEIALLKATPALGRFSPIADIVYLLPSEQIVSAYRNVVAPELASVCQVKQNIPQYIDNLVRLNLVARPIGQQAAEVAYRPHTRAQFVKDVMKAGPPKSQIGVDKAVIGLTDLGDLFRRACTS